MADRNGDGNETERNISSARKETAFLTSVSNNVEEDDCLLCANSTNLSLTGLSKAVNGSESNSGTEMELTQAHQNEQAENPKWMIDSLHEEEKKTNEEGEKTVYKYKHVIIMEYNGTLTSDENNQAQKQKHLEQENKTLKNDLHKNRNSIHSVSGEKTDEAFDSYERPFAKASEQIIKTIEDEIVENGKTAAAISDMNKGGFEEKEAEQRNNGDTVDEGFAEDLNIARRFEEDFIDGSKVEASDKMSHQFCEDELEEPTPRSRGEKISEFFVALSEFLKRVGHKELRELLDNNSTGVTLTERLKEAVAMKNDKEFHKLKDAFAKKKKNEDGLLKQPAVTEQQRYHHRLPPTNNSAASEVESIAVNILNSVDKLLQLQMQFPDENVTNGHHQQGAHLEQNLTPTTEMSESSGLNNISSHEIGFDNDSASVKNDKSKMHFSGEVDGLDNKDENLSNNLTKDARKQSNDLVELTDDILELNATLLLFGNSSEQAESQRSVAPDDSTHGYAEAKLQDSSISSIKLSRLSNSFQIPSGITWNGVDDHKYRLDSENSVDDSLTPGMEIIKQNLSDRIKKLFTERSLS